MIVECVPILSGPFLSNPACYLTLDALQIFVLQDDSNPVTSQRIVQMLWILPNIEKSVEFVNVKPFAFDPVWKIHY